MLTTKATNYKKDKTYTTDSIICSILNDANQNWRVAAISELLSTYLKKNLYD